MAIRRYTDKSGFVAAKSQNEKIIRLEAENKQQADFLSLAKEQMDADQVEKEQLQEKIRVLELAADLTTYTKEQLQENKLLRAFIKWGGRKEVYKTWQKEQARKGD